MALRLAAVFLYVIGVDIMWNANSDTVMRVQPLASERISVQTVGGAMTWKPAAIRKPATKKPATAASRKPATATAAKKPATAAKKPVKK